MMMEKQIEETANEMYRTLMLEAECELSGMDCSVITSLLVNRKGYRKASDVADEILADVMVAISIAISENIEKDGSLTEAEADIVHALVELKKKYTEGDTK